MKNTDMAIYYSKISGLKMPRIQTKTWVTGLALTPVLLVVLFIHFTMLDTMTDATFKRETAKICAKNNPGLDQILCPISNLYR
jgi:hypothetical protein